MLQECQPDKSTYKWNTDYRLQHKSLVYICGRRVPILNCVHKKLKFVGNFIFQTGQPTNYPNSQYNYMNLNVPNYGVRNSQRLPNYHRLDINLTLTPKNRERKIESSWIFGVYNLYDRDNASSIIFSRNNETLKNEAIQISIFGIVPSVTYNFKF